MMTALYSRFEPYPSPVDYMEQIVNRLCNPEDSWQAAHLHLRILKQFIKYDNYLADTGFSEKRLITGCVQDKIGKKPTEADVLPYLDGGIIAGLAAASKAPKNRKICMILSTAQTIWPLGKPVPKV